MDGVLRFTRRQAAHLPAAGTRSAKKVLGRRPRGSPRPPTPVGGSRGSTPRTTATGTEVALPMTSSAADATSSATQTSVATRTRPRASAVPRRSTTAARPANPMATSMTPVRQVRPKVSDDHGTSCPRGARRPSRMRAPSGRSPRGAGPPSPARRWTDRPRRWRIRAVPGLGSEGRRVGAGCAPTPTRPRADGPRGHRGRSAPCDPRPWTRSSA